MGSCRSKGLTDPTFLSNPHITSNAGSEEGDRHCRGMASLIALRGSEQFSRLDGRNLVYFVCHCTVGSLILESKSIFLTRPASQSTHCRPRVSCGSVELDLRTLPTFEVIGAHRDSSMCICLPLCPPLQSDSKVASRQFGLDVGYLLVHIATDGQDGEDLGIFEPLDSAVCIVHRSACIPRKLPNASLGERFDFSASRLPRRLFTTAAYSFQRNRRTLHYNFSHHNYEDLTYAGHITRYRPIAW